MLGYNDNISINTGMPLFDAEQVGERDMNNCKILADVSILENFNNVPHEFSLVEANITRKSTGQPENVLLMRRLSTAPDGQKFYADEDKVVLMPHTRASLGETEVQALGLPAHVTDSLWLGRTPDKTAIYITNMSDKTRVTTTIASGALNESHIKGQGNTADTYLMEKPEFAHDYTVHADKVREGSKRPQIGKDRRIEGGEYTTAQYDNVTGKKSVLGEIIVVDTSRPEELKVFNDLKAKVLNQARNKQGMGVMAELLAIEQVVATALPYSLEGVQELLEQVIPDGEGGIKDGGKVNLDYFIGEKVGVCRHQALLAGKLAEMMIENHELQGQVSVDRNELWNPMSGEKYGHAWMRYTDPRGEVYVVDAAQGYTGLLREAPKNGWNYMRDEDKRTHTGRTAGARILSNI